MRGTRVGIPVKASPPNEDILKMQGDLTIIANKIAELGTLIFVISPTDQCVILHHDLFSHF